MSFEARVWCEDGDLLGYVEVIRNDYGKYVVEVTDADPDSGYLWNDSYFESEVAAERHAKHWAGQYEECWQDQCYCGESDCGVMYLHGIYVQYVRDGRDVDQ
jgi:hypothetical protein